MAAPYSPRDPLSRGPPGSENEELLAYEYGLARLRQASIQKRPNIYESYAGVLSPRTKGVRTLQNPIYERRALTGAVSRLRSAACSTVPSAG